MPAVVRIASRPEARTIVAFVQSKRLGCDAAGALSVQQHDFFKLINWRKLERREVRAQPCQASCLHC